MMLEGKIIGSIKTGYPMIFILALVCGFLEIFLSPQYAWASEVEEKSIPLFILERLNYKSYKSLHYDAVVNPKDCTLNKEKPLDSYYLTKGPSPTRLTMSWSSREYFLPKDLTFKDDRTLQFTFKALQSFATQSDKNKDQVIDKDSDDGKGKRGIAGSNASLQKKLMASPVSTLTVTSELKNGACVAWTTLKIGKEIFAVKLIEVNFKLFLGLIVGLDYVILRLLPEEEWKKGEKAKVSKEKLLGLCLYGPCENL